MKDKATSFDIAYMAGVSQSTVSRALRNSPQVNKETREKVQAIARQLNYKVDKNASNLRQQRSSTLALLLFEDPTTDESLINPFFLSMLGSITRACAKRGQDLLVSFQQLSDDWHADYEDSNKADGIILLGYGDYKDYEEKLAKLLAQETHFVCWGGRLAGEHLLATGHKRFAFIGNASEGSPEFSARYRGFIDALNMAGISEAQVPHFDAISTESAGDSATEQLLAAGHQVDAIFCASDLIAIGVMRCLKRRNLRVPEDIAVMGFDDIPVASFATPALSTIQQDTTKAGELLVNNLLQLVNNQPISVSQIEPKLIIRQSCGYHLA
jgi:DNA-binding LacI/PurR family transcriptional regulator